VEDAKGAQILYMREGTDLCETELLERDAQPECCHLIHREPVSGMLHPSSAAALLIRPSS